MQIRDAVEADLPAIVAIYNTAIPCRIVTADLEPVTIESRRNWFQAHTADSRPLWVAEMEETITPLGNCVAIAGWLGFQSFYGRPAYATTAEISIYVDPGYQRRGIGQALLQQAIVRSPALGIKTLLGFIFADNQPSLRLFERFGFQRWGHLPGVAKFDAGEQDLVIVGLRLG